MTNVSKTMTQQKSTLCSVARIRIILATVIALLTIVLIALINNRYNVLKTNGIQKSIAKRSSSSKKKIKVKTLKAKTWKAWKGWKDWYKFQQSSLLYENITQLLNKTKIKENSKHYSKLPHEPGSKRNEKLAKVMKKKWKEYGLDKTELFKYKLLLSFPERPAELYLMNGYEEHKKLTIKIEDGKKPSERNGDPVYPFNAYSVSGDISAEVVYCNYGSDEDYEKLNKLNVKLKKKIFLIR